MNEENRFSKSHKIFGRIEAALRERQMTAEELGQAVSRSKGVICRYIAELQKQKQIHIARWETRKNRHVWHIPIYEWGADEDAPPPKKMTDAERKRARAKARAIDPEILIQEQLKKKAAAIKPFRDWTAAWIPTRGA